LLDLLSVQGAYEAGQVRVFIGWRLTDGKHFVIGDFERKIPGVLFPDRALGCISAMELSRYIVRGKQSSGVKRIADQVLARHQSQSEAFRTYFQW
jgi:hypothetical protein